MKFIIGRNSTYEDNIYWIHGDNTISRLTYNLPNKKKFKNNDAELSLHFPYEITERILDYVVDIYITNFKFKALTKLLYFNKAYLHRFYKKYLGSDIFTTHNISSVTEMVRVFQTLKVVGKIAACIYSCEGSTNTIRLSVGLKKTNPMPWDVEEVCLLEQINLMRILYYDYPFIPVEPEIFNIGNVVLYLEGNTCGAEMDSRFLRLPTIVLSLSTDFLAPTTMPILLAKKSQAWHSVAQFLHLCFGKCTGVFYEVDYKVSIFAHAVESLPNNKKYGY